MVGIVGVCVYGTTYYVLRTTGFKENTFVSLASRGSLSQCCGFVYCLLSGVCTSLFLD